MSRMSQERIPCRALHNKVYGINKVYIYGQRNRERSRKRWIGTVTKDLEQKGLSMSKAITLTSDRKHGEK